MADLLECLLQMKGLRESMNRLSELASVAARSGGPRVSAVAETASGLVAEEQRWAAALGAALPGAVFADGSATGPGCGTDDAVGAFLRARHVTLEILDDCSAADLAASTTLPDIGRVTVADIVAHMLASDTDRLGALRATVGPTPSPHIAG